jgi:hypothetical protein
LFARLKQPVRESAVRSAWFIATLYNLALIYMHANILVDLAITFQVLRARPPAGHSLAHTHTFHVARLAGSFDVHLPNRCNPIR